MVSRKRTRAQAEENDAEQPAEQHQQQQQSQTQPQDGLLHQLRNMWEFANLMQYIFTFGKLVKISDDIEVDVRLGPLSCSFFLSFILPCSAPLTTVVCGLGFGNRMLETRSLSSTAGYRPLSP